MPSKVQIHNDKFTFHKFNGEKLHMTTVPCEAMPDYNTRMIASHVLWGVDVRFNRSVIFGNQSGLGDGVGVRGIGEKREYN